jgi:hypothetical protein
VTDHHICSGYQGAIVRSVVNQTYRSDGETSSLCASMGLVATENTSLEKIILEA